MHDPRSAHRSPRPRPTSSAPGIVQRLASLVLTLPMAFGGALAGATSVSMIARWAMLGRIPAALPEGGGFAVMEVASVGLLGSMALVLLCATLSSLRCAFLGLGGPLIPRGILRIFGTFVVAMFAAGGMVALTQAQSFLGLLLLPVVIGLCMLVRRR